MQLSPLKAATLLPETVTAFTDKQKDAAKARKVNSLVKSILESFLDTTFGFEVSDVSTPFVSEPQLFLEDRRGVGIFWFTLFGQEGLNDYSA